MQEETEGYLKISYIRKNQNIWRARRQSKQYFNLTRENLKKNTWEECFSEMKVLLRELYEES